MRHSIFPFLGLLLFVLTSCKDQGVQPRVTFDSMVFDRTGSGQLTFSVSPSVYPGVVDILISRLDNRDTNMTVSIQPILPGDTTFVAYFQAIAGQCGITGDFQQTTLPSGTWVREYMVRDGIRQEITNVSLRNKLLRFEQLVRIAL